MDFWGKLVDGLKYSIMSMSKPLNKIYIRLDAQYTNIVEHLLKIYFFRDSQWKHDWVVHTWKAAREIDMRKGVNRYPLRDWIYHVLWEDSADIWEKVYRSTISGFAADLKYLDTSVVQKKPRMWETAEFVRCYMLWLSGRLAEHGEVSLSEAEAEVDRLLGEFPFVP
jgi:hypothetical protein